MNQEHPGGGDLLITGGSVMLPGADEPVAADVLIIDGRIAAIGSLRDRRTARSAPAAAGEAILDATGLLVLPGVVDPHVHFDEPGFTDREDFYHGTSAAASGGVTTVVDMPCTSVPPVTNKANFDTKYQVVSKRAVIDYGLYGGVAAESFGPAGGSAGGGDGTSGSGGRTARPPAGGGTSGSADEMAGPGGGVTISGGNADADHFRAAMQELAPHVLGFKTYFISIMDLFHQLNHYQFRQVLKAARDVKRPVLLHAEDLQYSTAATEAARAAGDTPRHFTAGRPENAEVLAIQTAAELARDAESDLHIVHVSTWRGARIVAANPFVTGETCPHYLAFSLEDFERIGSPAKVTPPIKAEPNRSALWDALLDGTLIYVASDHAPAPTEQKNTGSIWTDYAGIPGSGTLLPFLYSEGVRKGRIPLKRLVEITSSAAARRWGIADRKGALLPGHDGDCVLIDPNETWTVRGSEFLSKGKVTPFEGTTFTGRVKHTIVRGTPVYSDGQGILVEPGYGRILKRRS